MKHYRDENNKVYAFEADGSQDFLIKPNYVLLTDNELATLRAPTSEQIAAQEKALAEKQQADATKADAVIQYLVTHTPQECAAYVGQNVTNLATAVTMLQKFAMALCVLSKERFK